MMGESGHRINGWWIQSKMVGGSCLDTCSKIYWLWIYLNYIVSGLMIIRCIVNIRLMSVQLGCGIIYWCVYVMARSETGMYMYMCPCIESWYLSTEVVHGELDLPNYFTVLYVILNITRYMYNQIRLTMASFKFFSQFLIVRKTHPLMLFFLD